MRYVDKKITFGVIVGTRGFFNSALAAQGRKDLLAKLKKLGYGAVILPADATPTGAVETLEDADKCAKLFQEERDKIDGVIVALPNFGDELGAIHTLTSAKLDVPILVQGEDDELDKLDVKHRRDSFCGKLSVCNNLYQCGIPFTDTTFHTEALNGEEFTRDLHFFARVCRVVNGLRHARIGAVGARPAAFQTMRFSEKLLQASGITVVTVDLSEIIGAANAIADSDKAVKARVKQIHAYGKVSPEIPAADLVRHGKLLLALERWIEANRIDAFAMQCWTSIQQNYGCQACLSMSMLGDKLIPAACEVDVNGAVSMYALTLAGGQPSALIDWNNNYAEQRDKCVAQHCSSFPRRWFDREVEITYPAVLSATLGREICSGAVECKAAPGPMSYCRVSNDDLRGRLRVYLGDGRFTDDPFDMPGGIAVVEIPNLQKLLKFMCRNGFEHHGGMVRGHNAEVLAEAFGTYMKWDVYRHE